MNRRFGSVIACLLPLLLAGGCLSLGAGNTGALPRAEHDNYTLQESAARSPAGCQFDYRIYQPAQTTTSTTIVIGHGFLRDQDNMIGLSRALANRGIPAVTLDFCNMRPWNGHHQRNAQDMAHLANLLGRSDNIIYAGFSAGALAALLAADDSTRAILALDLVDQDNLGRDAIEQLTAPLIGLAGPPSACNANNQAEDIFSMRNDRQLESLSIVAGASHCEFESPSNWLCEVACGDDDSEQADTMQRSAIIKRSINAVLPFLAPHVTR